MKRTRGPPCVLREGVGGGGLLERGGSAAHWWGGARACCWAGPAAVVGRWNGSAASLPLLRVDPPALTRVGDVPRRPPPDPVASCCTPTCAHLQACGRAGSDRRSARIRRQMMQAILLPDGAGVRPSRLRPNREEAGRPLVDRRAREPTPPRSPSAPCRGCSGPDPDRDPGLSPFFLSSAWILTLPKLGLLTRQM